MSNQNRNILIGIGVGLIVIVCCCVVVLAAVFFIDPYGVVGRMTGTYDPIAKSLPADTLMYGYADLKSIMTSSEEFEELIRKFVPEDDISGELTDDFFEQFEDETGMNFQEDIMSWMGQYAGFAIPELDYESLEYGNEPAMVLLVEVNPFKGAKADEFLTKLMDVLAEDAEYEFNEEGVEGTTVYIGEFPYSNEKIIIARHNSLLIGSNSFDTVKDIITSKESLSNDPGYKKVSKNLPKDRLFTVYIDPSMILDTFEPIYDELGFGVGGSFDLTEFEFMTGMGYSFGLDNGNPRIDFVMSYDLDSLPEEYMASALGKKIDIDKLAGHFPKGTYFYMSSSIAMENIREGMEYFTEGLALLYGLPEYGEFEETLDELSNQLGFNVIDDFLALLNGEMALGIYEYEISEFLPIGFNLLVETSDIDKIKENVESIALFAGEMEFIDHYEKGELDLYSMEDYYGDPMGAFGTYADYLVVGMSKDSLEASLNNSNSLADSGSYKTVRDMMPKDLTAYFHFDLSEIVRLIYEFNFGMVDEEAEQFIDALGALGIGAYMPEDDVAAGTLIIEIKD